MDELCTITEKYGITNVILTDMAMPASWPQEMFPILKAYPVKFRIFIELRTNLTGDQIREMAEAGIVRTQPGIENLSDHVLRLMNKGTTCLNNLVFLKNSRRYGIEVAWNMLLGFPGEELADYTWQIKLLPLIEHFETPNCCADIVMARDSEYFKNPEKYGLQLRPKFYYRFLCPKNRSYGESIAIYYDNKGPYQPAELRKAAKKLGDIVFEWIKRKAIAGGSIRLECARIPEGFLVIDTRSCSHLRAQLGSKRTANSILSTQMKDWKKHRMKIRAQNVMTWMQIKQQLPLN